jgi:Spy/CpxP family protein refolding chaperone
MKKTIFLILMVFITAAAFAACASGADSLSNKEVGQNYINDFLNKNFDGMVKNYNYTDEMKKAISADFLSQTYNALILQTGQFKSKADIMEKSQSGYDIIYENITFENMQLTLNVVFDKNNLIAGFSITPVN